MTVKISQVLDAGGAGGRLGSNHYGFSPLMMGRELIYPGEKQIKALLSPVLCHTIAYINILSWAIQVSKGLVHLHFHKGPLSTPWPPLPSRSPPDECLLSSPSPPPPHTPPPCLPPFTFLASPSIFQERHLRHFSSCALLLVPLLPLVCTFLPLPPVVKYFFF